MLEKKDQVRAGHFSFFTTLQILKSIDHFLSLRLPVSRICRHGVDPGSKGARAFGICTVLISCTLLVARLALGCPPLPRPHCPKWTAFVDRQLLFTLIVVSLLLILKTWSKSSTLSRDLRLNAPRNEFLGARFFGRQWLSPGNNRPSLYCKDPDLTV